MATRNYPRHDCPLNLSREHRSGSRWNLYYCPVATTQVSHSPPCRYGVGVDPREKPWSQLNERQRQVVADLGWGAATWDDNLEHDLWFRELSAKMRSKAKSIGLDEQQWDTKKFLASPEGRKSESGTAWKILAVATALLAVAAAAVVKIMRAADERRRLAAVWQKQEWSELSREEQAAVSALALEIEGDASWRNRFEICARVPWDCLVQQETRAAAAQSLGVGPESWPPALGKLAEDEDVLADLASAADATETFSLKLRPCTKNPSAASTGITLDRAGVVTAVPSTLDGLQLGGRQLLFVEGVDVSASAMTADERASALQTLLLSRSPGQTIDLTFSH